MPVADETTSAAAGPTIDLARFTTGLYLKDGLWFAHSTGGKVSYPEEGNMDCFQMEQNSFWFAHRNACIAQAVSMYSPHVLFFDIGGGNGYVAKGLEDSGVPCVLVEPGLQGALNARRRGLRNIVCSTFTEAGIKPNSVKAAGLFDVVEHIEHDKEFIGSLRGIMADGGLVYITVPAFRMLWSDEDVHAGHFRRYTRRKLNNLLRSEGFDIVFSTYIFSVLPLPVFLFRTIPSMFHRGVKPPDVERNKQEHAQGSGLLSWLLSRVWNWELARIKRKRTIPFGGSCFVVARKAR